MSVGVPADSRVSLASLYRQGESPQTIMRGREMTHHLPPFVHHLTGDTQTVAVFGGCLEAHHAYGSLYQITPFGEKAQLRDDRLIDTFLIAFWLLGAYLDGHHTVVVLQLGGIEGICPEIIDARLLVVGQIDMSGIEVVGCDQAFTLH